MSFMATKRDSSVFDRLSKTDIISIIKACHKHRVKNIKIEGLEINLSEEEIIEPQDPAEAAEIDNRDLDKAAYERTDDDLMDLAVTDPEAYEQALLDRDLQQDAETSTQDR
jgi:hypothetical protein